MPVGKLDHNTETNYPVGSPYFEFKSTLKIFIAENKWESLKQSAYNMLAIFPEEAFGWFALGMAFSRLGDTSSAIINLKKAVSSLQPIISNDKLPSYLLAQAKLLYENESETSFFKLRQANNLLTSAIDLDDNFALAYYERAFVKSMIGDAKGCLRDKTKAFQLDPELRNGHTFSLRINISSHTGLIPLYYVFL